MKKNYFLILLFLLAQNPIFACTNLLVGKNASVDGSTMITYSADSYTLFGELYHFPAAKYPAGTKLKVYDWDSGKFLGEIDQVRETYNVISNMNEHQVAISETTFGGRPELENPEGIIDYGSLIYITLQRAKTAKEAIKIMTDLVEEYGYFSGGESFSIADPNEIWIVEMSGKGKGVTGAVWVAIRIPDDCISAHANHSRIHQFPLNDSENCIYSKDVISFSKEKGYYNGSDKDFSFSQAYAPADFGALRYCEARVWSFFNKYSSDMEQYLPYAKGEVKDTPMPLYIKANQKLSLSDLKAMMRDHYEGTALDWRFDVGAGQFESPYRWAPLEWEVDGTKYCNERPIATQQTAFTFVAQMRSWLPNTVGGILWFGMDDAAHTIYTPMYTSMTETPECFKVGNGDLFTFSWTSSFWIHNWVANMVYNRYNQMHPDVLKVQQELETKFQSQTDETDKQALALLKDSEKNATDFLTKYSINQAQYAFTKWKSLGEFLMIKYMDGVSRNEENGVFKTNEYGAPASPTRPGYSKEHYKNVIKETGDKYKVFE